MQNRVYLDYSATTPVDKQVTAAMLPFFTGQFGNPSSIHWFGQQAEAAVEESRRTVAEWLGCRSGEVVFTSGGTESDNLGLRGIAFNEKKRRRANHVLLTPVEHYAVLRTASQLHEEFGFIVEYLRVDETGLVDLDDLRAKIRPETAVVSVIYANNEIGTISPVQKIGEICFEKGVPFFTDAVQAAAHLPINISNDAISALAIGAHKFYGPKGVGALFLSDELKVTPTQTGGNQEGGRRAGTENVPYIVGLAQACRLTQSGIEERAVELTRMRDMMIDKILGAIPGSRLTGHLQQRLPNHASFVFEGVNGNLLISMLDSAGFACSSGSACKVGSPKPSEVLLAMGIPPQVALGSLRVTLGRETATDEVKQFLEMLPKVIQKNRSLT